MKVKRFFIFFVSFLVLAVLAASVVFQDLPEVKLNTVDVNDTVKTLADHWENIQMTGKLPSFEYQFDFTVINDNGNFVAVTRRGLNENLNDAIRNRDTAVDITIDGETVGKAVFYNNTAAVLQENRKEIVLTSILIFVVLAAALLVYTFYVRFTLIRPFQKLQGFARHIAAGNFDIPLEKDKRNLFGAFTESFDLMREELNRAKENERKAEQSKKELVASLSHDIKTPVASIKAVTEYMTVTSKNEEDKKQLEIINMKAEQINSLITDMFHATLEELQALSVTTTEVQSGSIAELIHNADYKGLVKPFSAVDGIVLADLLRLQQAFDNIIGNSYKYAETDIEINTFFEDEFFVVDIIDFGAGVPREELPFLFNKFYRGKDAAAAKSGYGLGLYISKYLLEQMYGKIRCENRPDGFAVRLSLRLA